MPRELKKRGRREQNKNRTNQDEEERESKRLRRETEHPVEIEVHEDEGDDFIHIDNHNVLQTEPLQPEDPTNQFYGLLDDEEQAYYANVNKKITSDDFESAEDRALFIAAVYRESQGKEIKLASSQSCSRHLEKIIQLSTPEQLRSLFRAFLDNLTYLVQHRFGSHCCETLFRQASEYVHLETRSDADSDNLEQLFLESVEVLKPNLGYLVTDRFATHTIRVLTLVLAGISLDDVSAKSVFSKRKEKFETSERTDGSKALAKTPKSFATALQAFIKSAFQDLDTNAVRSLATHPTGSPYVQLCLKLELAIDNRSGKNREMPLYTKLFPETDYPAESESAKYITGLVYDTIGSHLVEVLVHHLPGKFFKMLYANVLRERMKNLAKNETASFIATKILERLGKDDLADARNLILPEIPRLVSRSRSGIARILLERSAVRCVDPAPLISALEDAYGNDKATMISKMLHFDTDVDARIQVSGSADAIEPQLLPPRADLHGSLLAQTMLECPVACDVIQDSLLQQSQLTLVALAKNPTASRIIQVSLTSDLSGPMFRRRFVPKFYGVVVELAMDSAGSHAVDALWHGTRGLHFLKATLAQELARGETLLRESIYGRSVWRNWSMDIYQKRPGDWQAFAKGIEPHETLGASTGTKKSSIQLARERYAKSKAGEKSGRGTRQPASVSAHA